MTKPRLTNQTATLLTQKYRARKVRPKLGPSLAEAPESRPPTHLSPVAGDTDSLTSESGKVAEFLFPRKTSISMAVAHYVGINLAVPGSGPPAGMGPCPETMTGDADSRPCERSCPIRLIRLVTRLSVSWLIPGLPTWAHGTSASLA